MQSGDQKARRSAALTRFGVSALLLGLLAGCAAAPAYANASVFVNTGVPSCTYGLCTAASTFGMLIGPGDAVSVTGTATVLNDIGLDNGAKITTTGTVNVGSSSNASILDFADNLTGKPAVPCTGSGCMPPSGSTLSAGTKVWGGTDSNPTLVNNAYTQFTSLAAYWNTHTGIPSLGAPTMGGNWNIGTTAGVHLYTATGNLTQGGNLTIGCGATLTLACDPTDLIVVVVPASFTVNITKNITFATASKLTDDQLLFLVNATGTGNGNGAALQIGAGASRTVHGDFFVPNGNFTLGNTTGGSATDFWGRIFANASNVAAGTDTINHGVTIEDESTVPEPGTWALMIGGFGALIYFHRRRKQTQAAE